MMHVVLNIVRRAGTFLHAEVRGVDYAAFLLASFTLLAQLVALVRDRVLAHTFGAGEVLDAFYASFRVPDMLYVLVASMVSVFVLIPFLEEAAQASREQVRHLLSTVLTVFGGALVVLSGVIVWYVHDVVSFLYGSFPVAQQQLVEQFIVILMIQPVLLGISSMLGAYVQQRGRFVVYSLAPILYNVGIVCGVVVLYPLMGLVGLAWGVVLGAGLHLLVQVPFVLCERVFPTITLPQKREVLRIVRTSLPRSLALASSQLSMLVLVAMGAGLASGSIAVFTFAYNLQSVPLSLIAASYSVAVFPLLAAHSASGRREAFTETLRSSVRKVVLWSLLATALFVVLRAQIVRVLLGSGAFDWEDTLLTGAALAVFVLSLAAQGVSMLLVRSCYAAGKTLVPFVAGVVQFVVTVGAAWGSVGMLRADAALAEGFAALLRVDNSAALLVLALACGYSVGAFVHAACMMLYTHRVHTGVCAGMLRAFFEALVAAVVAGVAAYGGLMGAGLLVTLDTFPAVLLQGTVGGVCGIAGWVLALRLLHNGDAKDLWEMVWRRVRGVGQ
jgi:putative peptidoglycan lipid II flippase